MRTTTCLTVSLLLVISLPTFAGKNAGGALIVHVQDLGQLPSACWDFIGFDPCEDSEDCFPEIESCEGASTQATEDPSFLTGSIVWFYAAFPEHVEPGVAVIYFGHDHNIPIGYIAGWGLCGPPGSLEIPDAGWPNDTDAGNSIAFGEPIVGDLLIRAYWFGVYGEGGNYLASAINPTGGYAAFVSDDNPGVLDEIHRFGQVRWDEPGYNECPEPLVYGACCYADGSCELLTQDECVGGGGYDWLGDGTVCEPNPCEPVATEVTSWGKIKSTFR